MLLIVEGPDGSGKSTLAKKLAEHYGVQVTHSGGPKDRDSQREAYKEYVLESLSNEVFVRDRSFLYGEDVYPYVLNRQPNFTHNELVALRNKLDHKVIYCHLDNKEHMTKNISHEFKAHKSKEHLDNVIANHKSLIHSYEEVMIEALFNGVHVCKFDYEHDTLPSLIEWIQNDNNRR
jgi:cytidylate kinase